MGKSCWPGLDPFIRMVPAGLTPASFLLCKDLWQLRRVYWKKTTSEHGVISHIHLQELLHSLVGKSTARLLLDRPTFELQKSIFLDFPLDCAMVSGKQSLEVMGLYLPSVMRSKRRPEGKREAQNALSKARADKHFQVLHVSSIACSYLHVRPF